MRAARYVEGETERAAREPGGGHSSGIPALRSPAK
jgi:hypothetical protein